MNNHYIDIKKFKSKEDLLRLEKLKIPPNWKNVRISQDYSSKIQVIGEDSKNRSQYIYHPLWKLYSNDIKFDNNNNLNISKLNKCINKFINLNDLSKNNVIAIIIQFMIDLNIRVGNEIYYEENESIGLCTMKKENIIKNKNEYKLIFKGKKGVCHEKILNSKHIDYIKKLLRIPGELLFQYFNKINKSYHKISSNEINDFLKLYCDNNMSTKDIRTYQANKIFNKKINELKKKYNLQLDNSKILKKIQIESLKYTARELGNTPKVCKDSYINPNNLIII